MATMTPRVLIEMSLKTLVIIEEGEPTEAEVIDDSYNLFEILLDSWSAERLIPYRLSTQNAFAMVDDTASYTIGSGQTWDIARPIAVEKAFVRQSDIDYPVKIWDRERYVEQYDKATKATRPDALWYDPDYPYGEVYLYPPPSTADNIYLDLWLPLSALTDLDTAIALPSEFLMPLMWNLALNLGPQFGKKAQNMQVVAGEANRSKQVLMALHGLPVEPEVDLPQAIETQE